MKQISSRLTWVHKRAFPVLWYGVIAGVLVIAFTTGAAQKDPMILAIPCVLAVVGFVVMKKLIFDLMDEVYDCGDELLVRNGGDEERVALSNIINVNVSTMINPPRIALLLDKAGRFGRQVVFSPQKSISLNPFAPNPVGKDLIERVDRARTKRRT